MSILRLIILALAMVALMPWASLAGAPRGVAAGARAADAAVVVVADMQEMTVVAAPVRCAKGKVLLCQPDHVAVLRQPALALPRLSVAAASSVAALLPAGQTDRPGLPPPRSA